MSWLALFCEAVLHRNYPCNTDNLQRNMQRLLEQQFKLPTAIRSVGFSFKYYLRSEENALGKRPIVARLSYQDKRSVLPTGVSIEARLWDATMRGSGRIIARNHVNLHSLNLHLDDFETKIRRIATQAIESGQSPVEAVRRLQSANQEASNSNAEIESRQSFWTEYQAFLTNGQKVGKKEATLKTYRTTQRHLIAWEKQRRKSINLPQLNGKDLDNFAEFLKASGVLKDSVVAKVVRTLKVFLSWASQRQKLDPSLFNHRVAAGGTAFHIALTADEVARIRNLNLDGRESLLVARDLFLFQVYTGLRVSDAVAVRAQSIHPAPDGRRAIHLTVVKTGRPLQVLLSLPAEEILRKYGDNLPEMNPTVINRHVKEIAFNAGLSDFEEWTEQRGGKGVKRSEPRHKLVSNHTARRTWATLSHSKGAEITSIQAVLGHSKVETTMRYLKISSLQRTSAVAAVWDTMF